MPLVSFVPKLLTTIPVQTFLLLRRMNTAPWAETPQDKSELEVRLRTLPRALLILS